METKCLLQERHYERFKIKEGALALLDCAIPFHIIDISTNGLAFRYVGVEKWFDDPVEIDIVHNDFSLKNLMVQTVSDLQVSNGFMKTRRHSVTFRKLSPIQLQQLEQFIQQYGDQGEKKFN